MEPSVAVTPDQRRRLWLVIGASSAGTLIEWYDFYIFGSLASVLALKFFSNAHPTVAYLATLAAFAVGFVVRPIGALVFGWLGDRVGRKYTFLLTLILMGGSTFAIGLIPSYESIGVAAPILVILIRLLQGFALGGEYGGAATYVAEHAPSARRGYFTSFIQTTATLGIILSLGAILAVRQSMTPEAFSAYGWRIPFLLSAILVAISVYMRLRMKESPMFSKIKAEGKISKNPFKESFGKSENVKLVVIALFGATAGQAVVWYTGQYYALSFIQKTCNIEFVQSNYIIAIALLLATPFFLVFGSWSDKAGRKWIMLTGLFLAVTLYRPIYGQMYHLTDLSTKQEQAAANYTVSTALSEAGDSVRTTVLEQAYTDGTALKQTTTETRWSHDGSTPPAPVVTKQVSLAGFNFAFMVFLIFVQVIFVTMGYGPIAAFLVELFPTRIRYTSMSLPYHLGYGVFGGLTPLIATSLYVASQTADHPQGNVFAGLWYPIIVAGVTFIVGFIFLSNKKKAAVLEE